MKLYSALFFSLISLISYCQDIPPDINNRLEKIREAAQTRLLKYRISNDGRLVRGHRLSSEFLHPDRQRIDSLGLKIDIQLIYDQPMRERVLQLLNNELAQHELDTFLIRTLSINIERRERSAFDFCQFDTLEVYRNNKDSIFNYFRDNHPEFSPSSYKYRTLRILQLDTTICYKETYKKLTDKLRKERTEYYKSGQIPTNLDPIAELAGHLGDSMFIEPLIAALDNPRNFPGTKVEEALVRMRVEPYYSDFINKNTLPLEEVKSLEYLKVPLEKYLDIWRTQEGFREVAKYLFSNAASVVEIHGDRSIVTQRANQKALMLIRNNLLNQELQELLKDVNRHPPVVDEIYETLYHWMQQNSGNYEIKRLW